MYTFVIMFINEFDEQLTLCMSAHTKGQALNDLAQQGYVVRRLIDIYELTEETNDAWDVN